MAKWLPQYTHRKLVGSRQALPESIKLVRDWLLSSFPNRGPKKLLHEIDNKKPPIPLSFYLKEGNSLFLKHDY